VTDTTVEVVSRGTRRPGRFFAGLLRGPGISILGICLALLGWEVAARWFEVAGGALAPFSVALQTAWDERSYRLGETWYTGQEVLLGFGISVGIGLGLALLIVTFRPFSKAVWPVLVMSQVIPKIAIAPVFLVWFGFSMTSKVLVAVLLSFFPIVIDSVLGLRSTRLEQVYLAQCTGAGRWRTFTKIRLPNALPAMFTGLKLAATFCVTGAIVGEFVGSDKGIGRAVIGASARLNTELTYAGVLYVAAMGFIAFFSLRYVERLAIPWHVSQRQRKLPRRTRTTWV
jgi:NitT/TauT family transport system permease protein